MRTRASIRAELDRIKQQLGYQGAEVDQSAIARLHSDPAAVMRFQRYQPDPWQQELLTCQDERLLLLCARQAGKSTVSAALATHVALTKPDSLILILSPSGRQSGELFRKVVSAYRPWRPFVSAVRENVFSMELANGSRILALPENEESIRGFSGVNLLIVDEASRVSDALYGAVRPFLATSKGRLLALSTPFGKRGWFYEAWENGENWRRFRITADECPRITPEFLAEERKALGERWYRQEYECHFANAIDCVFSAEDIAAAFTDDPSIKPILIHLHRD